MPGTRHKHLSRFYGNSHLCRLSFSSCLCRMCHLLLPKDPTSLLNRLFSATPQPTDQSTDRPTDQSTDRPIDQSTNQHIIFCSSEASMHLWLEASDTVNFFSFYDDLHTLLAWPWRENPSFRSFQHVWIQISFHHDHSCTVAFFHFIS